LGGRARNESDACDHDADIPEPACHMGAPVSHEVAGSGRRLRRMKTRFRRDPPRE
jgi:hypothetical protein